MKEVGRRLKTKEESTDTNLTTSSYTGADRTKRRLM